VRGTLWAAVAAGLFLFGNGFVNLYFTHIAA
jgi:hypothetical protein